MKLDELLRTPLDSTVKGMPDTAGRCVALGDVGRMGWNLLRGDLPTPVATLDGGAMAANGQWMRAFTEANGIRICPHGKTTMAPQLFRNQLEQGAWGITVATVQQLQVCRRYGIHRVLMANQLVGEHDIRSVLGALRDDAWFDFYCLVDSSENVRKLRDMVRELGVGRPLQVLLEGGVRGGRTGCRSFDEAMALAYEVSESGPHLVLAGVEGFEGVIVGATAAGDLEVRAFIAYLCALMEGVLQRDLFVGRRPILTIGGSIYFDLVAMHPGVRMLRDRCDVVLRSGCYLTHDSCMLTENFRRIRARMRGLAVPGPDMRPALTVWGVVQSLPEPGLAILNVGKRDVSFDVDLPVAEKWFRRGVHDAPVAIPEPTATTQINDQHLFLRVSPATQYRVGDVIGLGVSHPCTTFDKWRLLYVIDDQYNVNEGILTFF